MRFDPQALKDDGKLRKLAMLVRSFHAMGGYLVQFNIVDNAALRDAQKHTEQYQDLWVRVATYSAYFVELSEQLQDDIINRLEFTAV
jgi:formate C-acetyltransferase